MATESKSKASAAKAKTRKKKRAPEEQSESLDAMSQCAKLCQESRWREACMVIRQVWDKAQARSNTDVLESLAGARSKIEFSLRRQMAASLVESAKEILKKEYLLDVGE